MGSKLIQFRLSGKDLEALETKAGDESINLYAQRIVKAALGLSTGVDANVDPDAIRQIVRNELEGLLGTLSSLQGEHERLVEEVSTLKKSSTPEPKRRRQPITTLGKVSESVNSKPS